MLRHQSRQTSPLSQGPKLRLFILFMIIWNYSAAQAGCQPPFDLFTTTINDSTISLNWAFLQTSTSGSYYYAEFREDITGSWTKAYFPYGDSSEYCLFTNLKRGKCYYYRVQGTCISSSGTKVMSDWTTRVFNNGAASCLNAPPNPPDPPAPLPYVNPDFSFTIDPCFPARVSFSNSTIISGTTLKSLEWNLGDHSKSSDNNPIHSYQKPGSYEVTLTVTDSSGKPYSKKITISLQTTIPKFADAGPDLTICNNEPATLHASGGDRYSWSPCIGLSNCEIPDPKPEPGTEQTYVVTVTDKDGCIDTDTVHVTYADPTKKIYVPNAFTPNNDGINDQFRPLVSLQGQLTAEWKLFNRFGNMIFSSNSSTPGWDGKYKGEPQPSGNYSYIINIEAVGTCPARNLKGTVMLIR